MLVGGDGHRRRGSGLREEDVIRDRPFDALVGERRRQRDVEPLCRLAAVDDPARDPAAQPRVAVELADRGHDAKARRHAGDGDRRQPDRRPARAERRRRQRRSDAHHGRHRTTDGRPPVHTCDRRRRPTPGAPTGDRRHRQRRNQQHRAAGEHPRLDDDPIGVRVNGAGEAGQRLGRQQDAGSGPGQHTASGWNGEDERRAGEELPARGAERLHPFVVGQHLTRRCHGNLEAHGATGETGDCCDDPPHVADRRQGAVELTLIRKVGEIELLGDRRKGVAERCLAIGRDGVGIADASGKVPVRRELVRVLGDQGGGEEHGADELGAIDRCLDDPCDDHVEARAVGWPWLPAFEGNADPLVGDGVDHQPIASGDPELLGELLTHCHLVRPRRVCCPARDHERRVDRRTPAVAGRGDRRQVEARDVAIPRWRQERLPLQLSGEHVRMCAGYLLELLVRWRRLDEAVDVAGVGRLPQPVVGAGRSDRPGDRHQAQRAGGGHQHCQQQRYRPAFSPRRARPQQDRRGVEHRLSFRACKGRCRNRADRLRAVLPPPPASPTRAS